MQKTETIAEERPQRAVRVVPIEPSLLYRYYFLIFGTFMLLFVIMSVFFLFKNPFGNGSSISYSAFWQHSLLSNGSPYFVICAIIYSSRIPRWRALDKRRQQAARYNLTVGAWARAVAQSKPNAPALPNTFAIEAQRSGSATSLTTIMNVLFLCILGAATYSYWQAMLPALQQGVPMALIALANASNIAILLLAAALIFLTLTFYAHQQLIATPDSLIYRRGFRTSSIPWQQACLFAVIDQGYTRKQEPVFFYELASKDTTIRWPSSSKQIKQNAIETAPSIIALTGSFSGLSASSAAEFPQQVQFLNIIIAERTGLPLYDLS